MLTFERELGAILHSRYGVEVDKIASSYLMELFQLAAERSAGTADCDEWKDLRRASEQIDLAAIRNAVCHPNRRLPSTYWYRLAGLVTDPRLGRLGFCKTTEILDLAETGRITKPSEPWLCRDAWRIPNNLPSMSDYSVTGLIGREKELEQLDRYLRNPRAPLIAVVAAGGVGKTALAMQLLERVVTDLAYESVFDAVVWVSAKTSRLTGGGIERLIAPESLDEVVSAYSSVLRELLGDSLTRTDEQVKALVVIDNLENLLRDDFDRFREMHLTMPSGFRVLVTSRVQVPDGIQFLLGPLSDGAATNLFRRYAASKSIAVYSDEVVKKACQKLGNNPLAVRLTVDRIALGGDIGESTSEVATDVAQFAFREILNAIDATERAILLLLFVGGVSTKTELRFLLAADADTFSAAFSRLRSTSLVTLVQHSTIAVERYALNPSVSELCFEAFSVEEIARARSRVQSAKTKTFETIREQLECSPEDWRYVPTELPAELRSVLIRATTITNQNPRSIDARTVQKITSAVELVRQEMPSDLTVLCTLADMSWIRGDRLAFTQYNDEAIQHSPPGDLRATWQKADRLLRWGEMRDAAAEYRRLIEARWGLSDKVELETATRISLSACKAFQHINDRQGLVELFRLGNEERDLALHAILKQFEAKFEFEQLELQIERHADIDFSGSCSRLIGLCRSGEVFESEEREQKWKSRVIRAIAAMLSKAVDKRVLFQKLNQDSALRMLMLGAEYADSVLNAEWSEVKKDQMRLSLSHLVGIPIAGNPFWEPRFDSVIHEEAQRRAQEADCDHWCTGYVVGRTTHRNVLFISRDPGAKLGARVYVSEWAGTTHEFLQMRQGARVAYIAKEHVTSDAGRLRICVARGATDAAG
jgi:hypothetical protein